MFGIRILLFFGFVQFTTILNGVDTFETPPPGVITVFNKSNIILEMPIQGAVMAFTLSTFTHKYIKGYIINSNPEDACHTILSPSSSSYYINNEMTQNNDSSSINYETYEWILISNNLGCPSQDKINNANAAGFNVIIIYNTESNESEIIGSKDDLISMLIPTYSIGKFNGLRLKNEFNFSLGYYVKIVTPISMYTFITSIIIYTGFTVILMIIIFSIFKPLCECIAEPYIRQFCNERKRKLIVRAVEAIPIIQWTIESYNNYEKCVICLENYMEGDSMRILSCKHGFHSKCIDAWILKVRRFCPICKDKFKYSTVCDDFSDSEISEGNYLTDSANEVLWIQNSHGIQDGILTGSNDSSSNFGYSNDQISNITSSSSYSLHYGTDIDDNSYRIGSQSSSAVIASSFACVQNNSLPEEDQWLIKTEAEINPDIQPRSSTPDLQFPSTYLM